MKPRATRPPDAEHIRKARYYLRKIGVTERQINEIPQLAPLSCGAPEKQMDEYILASAELTIRIAKRELGMPREAALAMVARTYNGDGFSGTSNLKKKLRDGGYHKRDTRTLVPSYMDNPKIIDAIRIKRTDDGMFQLLLPDFFSLAPDHDCFQATLVETSRRMFPD
jgi:hypothetical protein